MSGKRVPNALRRILAHPWTYRALVFLFGLRLRPAFIVGCGHSGTTIMVRVLGHHSRVTVIPQETGMFLRDDAAGRLSYLSCSLKTIRAGTRHWLEKTPGHVLRLEFILRRIPHAKVILMVRDGRDVAVSRRDRNGGTIESEIEEWVSRNQEALPFLDHPRVKAVRYEDFIREPEKTLSGLLGFLGLPPENLLEYHKTPVTWGSEDLGRPPGKGGAWHGQHRNWQINQPLYATSVGRWKSEMSPSEMKASLEKAGPLLRRFGYE